jgi:7-cyano-7-deazaguanine synthase
LNLILLSGGLDSALCLHKYGAALAVGFDYGQKHSIELSYAREIAAHYDVPFEMHDLAKMPLIDDIVFAGRNAVLIASGVAIAQARGLERVIIGCNYSDRDRFADCRTAFIQALSDAYEKAYGVSVFAPLLLATKREVVAEARIAGLPQTWTCYNPTDAFKPCGECYACKSLVL